jgi:putative transposase
VLALISRVTDAVLDDVREWQARPLEDVYPILFLDALIVKVRDAGAVRNLACYVAIGVNLDGERDVLGLWFQRSEAPNSGCRCSTSSSSAASATC